MNEDQSALPSGRSISDVERETGLAKETLRVWERRYGFPVPTRDGHGQRVYPQDEVDKLRLLKRLLDLGHRPGRIIHMSLAELQALSLERTLPRRVDQRRAGDLEACLDLCRAEHVDALRFKLDDALVQLGLYGFVTDFVAPLNVLVGEAWASGRIAVFEEHLYTESVQVVMRRALAAIPSRRDGGRGDGTGPRLLLTTLPQERHGLGLLMVEALASLEGASCVSLGVQTPVDDIVRAAKAHGADIVALSFSMTMRPSQVLDGLRELRSGLPASVEIWAGGSATVLRRRPPEQVRVLGLREIAEMLADWRLRRAA